jgi:hypothetical protein
MLIIEEIENNSYCKGQHITHETEESKVKMKSLKENNEKHQFRKQQGKRSYFANDSAIEEVNCSILLP